MSFASLPDELIIAVLKYSDVKTLLRFASTCKHYNDLTRTSGVLQCITELASLGYVAAPWIEPSVELLDRVKHHEEAWRTLSFTSEKRIMKAFAQCHHELCCEVAYGDYGPDGRSYFTFHRAPAVYRGVTEENWKLSWISDEDRVHDITAFDSAQDLLVVFEVDHDDQNGSYAHFLSLKTGLSHPIFGRAGPLTVETHTYFNSISLFENRLMIWKSFEDLPKSPQVMIDISARERCFLSPPTLGQRFFLSPELSIYVSDSGIQPSLVVSHLLPDENGYCPGHGLDLPRFREVRGIHIGDFAPPYIPSAWSTERGAFLDDPKEQILHVRFYMGVRSAADLRLVDIYVRAAAMLSHLPADCSTESSLTWASWHGEENCLIMESYADDAERGVNDSSVYGARAVRLSKLSSSEPRAIEVLDFHPRRVMTRPDQVKWGSELPGRFMLDRTPLSTRLPYTVARHELPEDVQGEGRAVIMENAVVFYPMLPSGTIDGSRDIVTFAI